MSSSPLFLRATERVLHEWDHLPNRWQGRAVPPFEPRTPSSTVEHDEPHDMPSPYPISGKHSMPSFGQRATPRRPTVAQTRGSHKGDAAESPPKRKRDVDRVAEEIRALQEKIRGTRER
ncbi:hypothetical protein ACI68E_003927 [Malassezia pachydermatis]